MHMGESSLKTVRDSPPATPSSVNILFPTRLSKANSQLDMDEEGPLIVQLLDDIVTGDAWGDDWLHFGPENDDHIRRLANALRDEHVRVKDLTIIFFFALSLPVARDLRDAIRSNTSLTELCIYYMQDDNTPTLSVLLEGVAA
jgi:hypothetical protein